LANHQRVTGKGRWKEASLDFAARKGDRATDVVFRAPKGSNLQVDDLLLYEPAD
jgi:hypothetical protein